MGRGSFRSLLFFFLASAACASNSDPIASTPSESALTTADDLVGAYSVDVSQAAFTKVYGLFVGAQRASDGSHPFFAQVRYAGFSDNNTYRVHGTVTADATSVTFHVDRNDPVLLALPTTAGDTGSDTQDRIVSILDGTFSLKMGTGGFSLSRGNFGWASYPIPFTKVASWCTSTADCDAEGIEHPACGGAWSCGEYTNLCTFTCRPVLAAGDLRIRMASSIPADGVTFMPIWIDRKSDDSAQANLEVVLDRPDAANVGHAEFTNATGTLDGWRAPFEARFHMVPCDARKSASCLGPLTVSVRQVGDPTILAQKTVQLVAPTDDLSVAACLGGGSIVSVQALETAAGGYDIVPRTFGNLAWNVGGYINDYPPKYDHFLNLDTSYPHANFTDIVDNVELKWTNDDATSLLPTGGFDLQYGHWALYHTPDSKLRIDELVQDGSGNVQRTTFAWDMVDVELGQFHLRGCVHYDASAPTIAFSP